MGQGKLRKAMGQAVGQAFSTWSARELSAVRGNHDAVVLIDCRPESKVFDALVVPASGGLGTFQLRQVTLDSKAHRWLAAAILRRAWIGFSP